jgi:uncharacterized protein YfaP (DUF2135 family)
MKSFLLLTFLFLFSCGKSDLQEGFGTLSGYITDGQTGNPIAGATVFIVGNQSASETTTDGTGKYTIANTSAGDKVVSISKTGFMTQTPQVFITKNITTSLSISLFTPAYASNKIIAILSWNLAVDDLDSHLFVPENASGPAYHVYYNDRGNNGSTPFAGLDVDDFDGLGPETIVMDWNGTALNYPRTYRYFVHNFTQEFNDQSDPGSGIPLTSTEAQVRVYKNGIFQSSFKVPAGCVTYHWHVFDMTHDGRIIPVNTCSTAIPPEIY